MTLTFVQRSFKVVSTIVSHSPLNILEAFRDRGETSMYVTWCWKVKLMTQYA